MCRAYLSFCLVWGNAKADTYTQVLLTSYITSDISPFDTRFWMVCSTRKALLWSWSCRIFHSDQCPSPSIQINEIWECWASPRSLLILHRTVSKLTHCWSWGIIVYNTTWKKALLMSCGYRDVTNPLKMSHSLSL